MFAPPGRKRCPTASGHRPSGVRVATGRGNTEIPFGDIRRTPVPVRMSRRLFAATVVLVLVLACLWAGWRLASADREPIRIGVLHSLTGPMARSEAPLVDAVRLAVDEINAGGGLLGRRVEMIVADSRSDPQVAAVEAERLIRDRKVQALFACWTSSCRQAVRLVVQMAGHLMFYPVQYEGLEQSDRIVYTGAAPNQQIVPGTRWALESLGKRIYLVGSDYVFPRTANLVIRDLVTAAAGSITGERLVPLGDADMTAVIDDLRRSRPDAVLNTLNGDSNAHFFAALKQAGLADLPVLSFSVAENELVTYGAAGLTGQYAVWSYFQSLPTDANLAFVEAFRRRFGANRVTSDPVESSYVAVRLWAGAVTEAGSAAPDDVLRTVVRQSVNAPSGIVSVDAATHHVWRAVRIGRARPDGQFDIVYALPAPVRPAPYPAYRSRGDWEALAKKLGSGDEP